MPPHEALSAAGINWKRLRQYALYCGLLGCGISGTAFYMNTGFSGMLLRADGHVARERVAISPAFEGRVSEVFVRPGDHVAKGQKIAIVKSVTISREFANLEVERARLMSKVAQLEARKQVIADTLPLARANAERAATFLTDLNSAQASGLVVSKSVQEMTSASLSAAEHAVGLQAELGSLSAEVDANRVALKRVTLAYDELSATYADGTLYASVSGDVGATVVPVGQVISAGNGAVADIFTGKGFVLAYLPDSYLFDVSEGQAVTVKARNEVFDAHIDRVLPLAQNLPSDLQRPNRVVERGRLVRIALPDSNELPMDQRVRIQTALLSDARGWMQATLQQTRAAIGTAYNTVMLIGSETKGLVGRITSAS